MAWTFEQWMYLIALACIGSWFVIAGIWIYIYKKEKKKEHEFYPVVRRFP